MHHLVTFVTRRWRVTHDIWGSPISPKYVVAFKVGNHTEETMDASEIVALSMAVKRIDELLREVEQGDSAA